MKKYDWLTTLLIVTLWMGVNDVFSSEPLAPTGLLTDLLEWTDRVWIDGLATQLELSDLSKTIEQTEVARIRSSHPAFSWIVNDTRQNILQTAYQFQLSGNCSFEGGSVWDSGKIESDNSTSVQFDFSPLSPDTIYYWRVRTWNNGLESPWSEPRAFLTASELWDETNAEYPKTNFDGPTSRYPIVLDAERPDVNENDRDFFDFKHDAFGYLVLTIVNPTSPGNRFEPGTKASVTIHLGERIRDGKVDRNPAGSTRYRNYHLDLFPGTHTYRIKNTPDARNTSEGAVKVPDYIGELLPFRYVEIERPEPGITLVDISRYVAHYPFGESASYFHSDSESLNQVWNLCRYSMKATSFAGIFVDGDRERIPYEGDALLNQLGYYCFDREYSLARLTQDYLINHPTWPTEWILQSVCMAWYDWLWTGDKKMLERRYNDFKAKSLLALADTDSLISTTGEQTSEFLESIHFRGGRIRDIVDWPHRGLAGNDNADSGETDSFVFTDKNVVVNSYHYFALKALHQFALLLDKQEDADQLEKQLTQFRDSFRNVFWDEAQGIFRDGIGTDHVSLHGNMFPLAFELVPDEDRKRTTDFIKSRGMRCSVYGSQFLLDALYEGNEGDEGFRLLTDTSKRSWLNMLRVGSTISLEAWDDIYKPNQDWNHAWGAAPANIIPRHLVGIEPTSPGFATMRIKPQISSLRQIDAVVPTIRGTVSVSIRKDEACSRINIVTPANTVSEVWLHKENDNQTILFDNAKIDPTLKDGFYVVPSVGSGSHQFEIYSIDET